MMRWSAALALTCTLAIPFVSPCAAQPAVPAPAPLRPVPADADTADALFQGGWSSDKDPGGVLRIARLGGDIIRIDAGGRFEAVGWVAGASAVALTSVPGAPRPAGSVARNGVLRLERRGGRTLIARFAADLGSAPALEETWTFRGRTARGHADAPVVVTKEGLPAFGEYVYVEELPEAVTKVAPVYPDEARKARLSGQVVIQALVGTDGAVHDTRVVKSVPGLDDAAVACVRQWRFKPALSRGDPVAVWVAVPVKFTLE
jgi:TonB family protein